MSGNVGLGFFLVAIGTALYVAALIYLMRNW
jgi:hypothetical protein